MKTITHGYGKDIHRWLPLLEVEGKKVSAGVKITFLEMIRCACGKDHTYVGIDTLARRTGVSTRTIQRHIAVLKNLEIIEIVEEWIKGWRTKVYYFLKHKVIDEMLANRNQKKVPPGTDKKNSDDRKNSVNQQNFEPDLEEKAWAEKGCPEDQVGDNLSSILINKENNKEPLFIPPEDEDQFSEKEGGHSSLWQRVCGRLEEEGCSVVKPVLETFTVREEGNVLTIEAPIAFLLTEIKKYKKQIQEEVLPDGFSAVSFAVQAKEHLEIKIEKAEKKRKKILALQQAKESRKEQENRGDLEKKSPKEQFDYIWQIYPRKKGRWRAFIEFNRARKQEGTPLVFDMIKLIEKASRTELWQKENGRFVPGLQRWFNEKMWFDYE